MTELESSLTPEVEISVSEGWSLGDSGVSVGSKGFAAEYHRQDVDGNPQTRILQVIGTSHRYTDLNGAVGSRRYSPDGSYLLISLLAPPLYETLGSTILLNTEGKVLWIKSDRRHFTFTDTAEAIAASGRQPVEGVAPDYEVFGLDGVSRKNVSAPCHWRVVLGRGDRALSGGRTWIAPFSESKGFDAAARIELPAKAQPIMFVSSMSSTKYVATQLYGNFLVLDVAGTIEYEYDPEALALADPTKTALDFAAYTPHPGPDPNTIVLFNRTRTVLMLNIADGTLKPKELDLTPPEGYRLLSLDFRYGRVFFGTPTALRYRKLKM